ncbi:hypothetical protein DOTSEDRAFT_70680 [Dothistroma septosporum NZE10]|uniref:Uncharacterized protein n=1 Tax=Dothistroma septosporum (strain NZE10 / CBS 128990) TaxID=675120 RepID=N1PTR4_DOTSN|nr:hypothetical protein DOTSEDRAFT_70680 [Dothistroma septosporum NZE10]
MPAPILNERQMRLMAQVWQCTKTDPVIDYTKLAQLGGFSTAKSAHAQWDKVKRRIKTANGVGGTQPSKVRTSSTATRSPGSSTSGTSPSSSKKRSSSPEANPVPDKRPRRHIKKSRSYDYESPSESSS